MGLKVHEYVWSPDDAGCLVCGFTAGSRWHGVDGMPQVDVSLAPHPEQAPLTVPGPPPPMEPRFEAVWQAIKRWDISRGDEGDLCDRMYAGATGDDVRTILAALDALEPPRPLGYQPVWHGCDTVAGAVGIIDGYKPTHVVTHWSDGTCTLDTIAAFRKAHQ
jgi:hypothetical protein